MSKISYSIASSNYLDYIIDEFFDSIIYQYPKLIKNIIFYYKPWCIFSYFKTYKNFDTTTLKKTTHRFITLFKANNYKDFKSLKRTSKENLILSCIYAIYLIYKNELESCNSIDFDDMINLATEYLDKNNITKQYKYIIIDEFQDSSYSKLLLIKKLINKFDSNLMVVGDDFQSIYQFTGCDLDIFINFNSYFKNSKQLSITNTYRNSQELINIAGSFVMKNDKQIKKNLISEKQNTKPIKIIYTSNYKNALEKLVVKIYNKNNSDILILGRNNYDINKYLNSSFILTNDEIIYKKNKDIKIRFLTVHRSKGLEASNVIIINLEDKINGFPNKIINPKILKLVLNTKEYYPFEEERRLFYVSLTRTKNNTYLLCNRNNLSIFIKELIKSKKSEIEILSINKLK